MKRAFLICIGVLWAGAAPAQDLQYDDAATQSCIANTSAQGDFSDCAGLAADTCINATSDGYTTVGRGYCLDQERMFWDAKLNRTYQEVLKRAQQIDAELAEIGSSAPPQVEALRNMQRAWITFRDAACEFEYSQWGGGTGGGPAYVSCQLSLTAEQTSRLSRWLEG